MNFLQTMFSQSSVRCGLVLKQFGSFRNIENNSAARLSPCLTLIRYENLSVNVLFTEARI